MAVPFMKAQFDYDFTLRFRIDNLREYFHRDATQSPPPLRTTWQFGPGWYFVWVPQCPNGEDCLSCFLAVEKDGYPAQIKWNLRGTSSQGTKEYFNLHLEHTFHRETRPQFKTALGRPALWRSQWDRFDTLRAENTLYITATVRAPITYFPSLGVQVSHLANMGNLRCLDMSHRAVTTGSGQPCDVRFAFSSPQGVSPTTQYLYAYGDDIKRTCLRLAECLNNPVQAREIVPGLFGEDSAGLEGAKTHTTAIRDAARRPDGDVDSDAEDDNKPTLVAVARVVPVTSGSTALQVPGHRSARVSESITPQSDGHGSDLKDKLSLGPQSAEEDFEWVLEGSPDLKSKSFNDCAYKTPSIYPPPVSTSEPGVADALSSIVRNTPAKLNVVDDIAPVKDDTSPTSPLSTNASPQVQGNEGLLPAAAPNTDMSLTTQPYEKCTLAVTGASPATWEALLFYLSTGTIIFAPLRSRGEASRKQYIADYKARNPRRPAPCSCKSIYRLARMLDMADLRTLALNDLRAQLSQGNILSEVFTDFTAQYDEVKDLELYMLKAHWPQLKSTVDLAELLQKVVRCNVLHASAIMGALW